MNGETYSFDKIDILLVDDRRENLLSLEAVLDRPEYNLVKARSGDEALRYLLQETPALILMDVQMPELNGFETAAIIKSSERTRDIPIIFVTAINKDEGFVHQGYDEGAVDYIYKPYDAHVLRAKVAVFVEIQRQHARISRLVAVQKATTFALGNVSNVSDAIASVLKSICTSLDWSVGLFWGFEKSSGALSCRAEWHADDHNAAGFIEESFSRKYMKGVGLPGKVWETQRARWLPDLRIEADFQRAESATQDDLRTAVAVPVCLQGEMMGVLEFFTRRKLSEDPDLVSIMGAIGIQIGQALKRTEALELVRASEARKTAVLEAALDCIITMDGQGKILEFNPAAAVTFGYGRGEVLGKELADLLLAGDGLRRYLATGSGPFLNRRLEMRARRADGTEFPVELAITRVSGVEPPVFTAFLRDITLRKRTEENEAFLAEATAALSSSLNYEQTFSTLANLAVEALADWCAIDLVVEGGLPRSVAVAHRDPAKVEYAKALREKYPAEWKKISAASNVLANGRPELLTSTPEEILAKGGADEGYLKLVRQVGPKSVMAVPLVARNKLLGMITLVSSDASRRYTKEDLAVAEELAHRAAIAIDNAALYLDAQVAIRARDEFFSIASHELKTPISVMKMSVDMIVDKMKEGAAISPEIFAKLLNASSRHATRLTRLVDDMLDVVKARAGKLGIYCDEMDLAELVKEAAEECVSTLAAAKCDLRLELEPEVIGWWDGARIEQILINLLTNAAKYAPGGPVTVSVTQDGETARMVVQDSGPGIPREKQAKIFDRFERMISTRAITGLGLGLFIVKQIVDAHQGSVRVESEEGKGARFIIELPLERPEAAFDDDLIRAEDARTEAEPPLSIH